MVNDGIVKLCKCGAKPDEFFENFEYYYKCYYCESESERNSVQNMAIKLWNDLCDDLNKNIEKYKDLNLKKDIGIYSAIDNLEFEIENLQNDLESLYRERREIEDEIFDLELYFEEREINYKDLI